MSKGVRKANRRQEKSVGIEAVPLSLSDRLKNQLHFFVLTMGLEVLGELLESEREEACGPRYAHNPERTASRMGHARGELVMGGRKVAVRRPRARTVGGKEVQLPSWNRFSNEDPLSERAVEQMVVGVSTRKYRRSLEGAGDLDERATSRSSVSRRFVAATEVRFQKWMARDLSELKLAALMIDGIAFSEHVVLVALGIDEMGRKHVLGLWEGATENEAAAKALLRNLIDRGLRTDRSILAIIDGSKALSAALRRVFGQRVFIQRCRVHKKRNVRDHLPGELQENVLRSMSEAYATRDPETAEKLLKNLARRIERDHPGAAASVREGLDETLTVKQFHLCEDLEKILSTTNPIENLNGSGRAFSRRVKRWRGGSMILRWMAAAVIEAEPKFRRVKGYKNMKKLVDGLRNNDRQIDGVDTAEQAA